MKVLILFAAGLSIAANTAPTRPSELTVHEWGTFTSVAGEDGSAIDWDTLSCKGDLPGFVNNFEFLSKSGLRGTVRMETPVMYFYSPRELDARVKVTFPQGLITEWYPSAKQEVHQRDQLLPATLNGLDTSLRNVTGAIEWNDIRIQPDTAPGLPIESGASRYYAARATDAAPIAVGDQHEKFLFYRGVGRFPVPLSVKISNDGKIIVENRGADPVPGVILFENRGGRIGYRNAGDLKDTVSFDTPSLDSSLPALRSDLETALIAQGLFPKEAQAMVETWRDSWFEEGARVIYIVPASAIEAILPLHVEPVPSATSRVFVGRIELVTPETRHAVQEAIATADWPTINRYRRFLDPILARISSEDPVKAQQVDQFRHTVQSYGGGQCR